MRSYKDLIAWQKGMDRVEMTYELTKQFPAEERYGLSAQLRRAAVSVISNVAEGYGRRTRRDYVHFLDMAAGSANEVETQLLVAGRLGYTDAPAADGAISLVCEVQRILKGLISKLEASPKQDVRNQRGNGLDPGPATKT
ncbi:MAG: four helix bundle protein [Phycisphaerae bacterium]|nr:four helix bundle protein [Phycisphaerae bacterium]